MAWDVAPAMQCCSDDEEVFTAPPLQTMLLAEDALDEVGRSGVRKKMDRRRVTAEKLPSGGEGGKQVVPDLIITGEPDSPPTGNISMRCKT